MDLLMIKPRFSCHPRINPTVPLTASREPRTKLFSVSLAQRHLLTPAVEPPPPITITSNDKRRSSPPTMDLSEARSHLLGVLADHQVPLGDNDVSWAFSNPKSATPVVDWVERYLGKDTLVSLEEAEM